MINKWMFTFAGIAAAVLLASGAFAGVPCAGTSTVTTNQSCAAFCPAGDMDTVEVYVTVLDCYGTPLGGKTVIIEPDNDDNGHCFCPGAEADTLVTDGSGNAQTAFTLFGGCNFPANDCKLAFRAVSEGVVLGPSTDVTTASPDSNADCKVDLTDFIDFASNYQTAYCCADYDCTGWVDLSDFIAFASHYQDNCP